MIVHLTGTLIAKEPNRCAIDVAGVGYGVAITLTAFGALPEAGATVSLPVHTYVREDQLTLYGFASAAERALFLKLIGVSGVGPKTAMGILSGLPNADLVAAIAAGDAARLATVPGVGKKTAERMIVELKDALTREQPFIPGAAAGPASVRDDALSALTNLGYPRAVAENALKKVAGSSTMSVEEAIRSALRELCRA